MTVTVRPPAAKLSLMDRKNIRDEWESKKADIEKDISDVLGVAWTVEVDPLTIAPYTVDDRSGQLGNVIYGYFEAVKSQLERFVRDNGDIGKDALNATASTHVMSLAVDEEGNYSYCGPTIKDGRLFIVFNENYVWTNVNDSLDGLLKVIDAADAASGSAGALSATVRSCIAQDFDPKIGDIQNDIRAILKNDAVTLNPNWEQVATDLASAGSKATDDWQTRVGFLALDYFDAAVRRLKEQNFDSDDMLQEAFAEAVSKNEIALRVVDTLKDSSKSYFQAIVEDGVLYIDILPDCFGTNSAYALENLDTILDAAL